MDLLETFIVERIITERFIICQGFIRYLTMNRKHLKKIGICLVIGFVVINIIAIFHAYKFTHFSDANPAHIRKQPQQLNILEKVTTLLFGISNPKPIYTGAIPDGYISHTLQSNVAIDIWEKRLPEAKGVVLLFHGYSSEKSSLLINADSFNALGYSTILVDFMGSGASEGQQITIGYLEAENVKTVFDYAQQHYSNIILNGNSMGAVAIMRAMAALEVHPQKIIIECPFASLQQTVTNRFEKMQVPAFPMAHLLTFWGGTINGFWAFDHKPTLYATQIDCPTLLMYGAKDNSVQAFETEAIFKNIKNEHKTLYIFPNAQHENYIKNYSDEWMKNISEFLEQ